jgi:hypothetical protein
MKWPKTKQTANAGVIFVESAINSQGSIFHPIHQESDICIDGFIELVDADEASGQLIAVQIKSGDSYLASDGKGFRVPVDQRHLDYWMSYMVPVILVCYSPTRNAGAWIAIRDFVEHRNYHDRGNIVSIDIPDYCVFNAEQIGRGIANLSQSRADERLLLACVDKCFSSNPLDRRSGFELLQAHPQSKCLKVTAFLAKRFILDEDIGIATKSLFSLGYAVGQHRWSWNPRNKDEQELIGFTSSICSDLDGFEIRRLIELCDPGPFNGPDGLGERCYDILCCCFDKAESILDDIARDRSLPITRRANALLMLNYGSWDELEDASDIIREQESLCDAVDWIFETRDDQQ